MALKLYSAHTITHDEITALMNARKIPRPRLLKIDASSTSGGWVIWWWDDAENPNPAGYAVPELKGNWFMRHTEATDFVNKNQIPMNNILKIDADTTNGGWVLWWYVAAPPAPVYPTGPAPV